MQNLFVSAMRSLVPIGVGLFLSLAGRLGIPVDSEKAALVVLAGLTAVYYLAFRGLEALAERMAWQPLQTIAGIFLGWAKPPQYVTPVTAPIRLRMVPDPDDMARFKRMLDQAHRDVGGDTR